MLTHAPKWSLPAGNTVVPSRWQATGRVVQPARVKLEPTTWMRRLKVPWSRGHAAEPRQCYRHRPLGGTLLQHPQGVRARIVMRTDKPVGSSRASSANSEVVECPATSSPW